MQDDWDLEYDTRGGTTHLSGVSVSSGVKKFHLALFLWALAGAAVGAAIGGVIYRGMYNASSSNVLMVGLVLAVSAFCILLACLLCEMLSPRITVTKELNLPRILMGLTGAAVVFGVGCLSEFLYELNSAFFPVTFNDFVFAIDDSGSMASTDAGDLRYDALAQLLDTLEDNKRVGLVRFTDSVYREPVELAPLEEEHRELLAENLAEHHSEGNTNIYQALLAALNICTSDQEKGRRPVVVLLSDGGSPVSVDEVSQQFLEAGVAISTVGLSSQADELLLQSLAQSTGGQYFRVEQADDLAVTFQQVSTAVAYRCLFSPRPGSQRGLIPYMILRVLFLLLPGVVIGAALILALGVNGAGEQLFVSVAAGLLAGLVMETGTFFSVPLFLTQTISWLLYGVVLLRYSPNRSGIQQGTMVERFYDSGSERAFEEYTNRDRRAVSRRSTQDKDRVDWEDNGGMDSGYQ